MSLQIESEKGTLNRNFFANRIRKRNCIIYVVFAFSNIRTGGDQGRTSGLKFNLGIVRLRNELHCNENLIYVFLFWELRGLSPNFHIHVSVSDLYILRIGPHISYPTEKADPSWEYINRSHTHEFGYWDCSCAIPFLGIFVSNFRYWFFAV